MATTGVVIDVRSPGEYKHGHLPGSVSLPLFTDEERKVVGTAYKQESREKAIKTGLDYFGPKMRPMVETVEALLEERSLDKNTPLCLYCWRGGMRSGAVAWLLQLYGFKIKVLAGGYKAFRNHVLQTFEKDFSFKVLGGYTGSGKTEILHALREKGEIVIDLEALANHKGSAFGNIGMPEQPTQEMFENQLALELHKLRTDSDEDSSGARPNSYLSPIWIEDESQRIGLLNIPHPLWKRLRQSPVHFLDAPFEERLRHIVAEYGTLDKVRLAEAISRITKRLGGLQTKQALQYLEEEAVTECFSILLSYYDKHYQKALQNRENLDNLLIRIPCETTGASNIHLLTSITV
ncbi:MAG: mnmH [Flaviaesturariibacter sp.]|nr:mnmH [Flaviaesturariibacter sp.]